MTLIKSRAVKIEDQMEVFWPQFNRYEKLELKALKPEEHKGHYSYNNSVIAFVDENGDMYVIPDIGIQKVLVNEGFTREFFYIPFSNWDYPVAYQEKWENLWKEKNSK